MSSPYADLPPSQPDSLQVLRGDTFDLPPAETDTLSTSPWEDLEVHQRGVPVAEKPVGRLVRSLRWFKRHWMVIAALLVLNAVVVYFAILTVFSLPQARQIKKARIHLRDFLNARDELKKMIAEPRGVNDWPVMPLCYWVLLNARDELRRMVADPGRGANDWPIMPMYYWIEQILRHPGWYSKQILERADSLQAAFKRILEESRSEATWLAKWLGRGSIEGEDDASSPFRMITRKEFQEAVGGQ